MATQTQLDIPKGDGNAAHYLDGTGNYSTPSGSTGPYSNVVKSSNSGAAAVSGSSFSAITNMTVTITTLGGPVLLKLQTNASNNTQNCGIFQGGANTGFVVLGFFRGVTQLSADTVYSASATAGLYVPAGSISFIDTPTAVSYTYTLQGYLGGSGSSGTVNYCDMVAMEI